MDAFACTDWSLCLSQKAGNSTLLTAHYSSPFPGGIPPSPSPPHCSTQVQDKQRLLPAKNTSAVISFHLEGRVSTSLPEWKTAEGAAAAVESRLARVPSSLSLSDEDCCPTCLEGGFEIEWWFCLHGVLKVQDRLAV